VDKFFDANAIDVPRESLTRHRGQMILPTLRGSAATQKISVQKHFRDRAAEPMRVRKLRGDFRSIVETAGALIRILAAALGVRFVARNCAMS